MEHFDLTGKLAIVLGSDQPAGGAIAAAFEEAGATVASLPQRTASKVSSLVTIAVEQLGGIDILATAPDLFLAKPMTEVTEDELANVMMANFASQFFAIQAVLPHLRRNERGNIIMVTSVLGERGLPNTSAYSAAHGAVFNLVRALSQELAPEAISVNGIELGWMEWMEDRLDRRDVDAQRAVRFTMSKRAGKAEDVGPLAVWLAGSAVGFVTGQVFPVDGGLTQHL